MSTPPAAFARRPVSVLPTGDASSRQDQALGARAQGPRAGRAWGLPPAAAAAVARSRICPDAAHHKRAQHHHSQGLFSGEWSAGVQPRSSLFRSASEQASTPERCLLRRGALELPCHSPALVGCVIGRRACWRWQRCAEARQCCCAGPGQRAREEYGRGRHRVGRRARAWRSDERRWACT